jgi:ABC-2 type transport system permease protein
MNMLQLTTSIKKEIWEYKKIFFWLPIIIASLMILAPLAVYLLNNTPPDFWITRFQRLAEMQDGVMFSKLFFGFVSGIFVPFLLVATLVQVYYFIACLFDERRDLSILFWRSLPVSDAMSVGVKLFVGALVLPVIFLIAATLTLSLFLLVAFILCSVLAISYDISLWGLWASTDVLSNAMGYWMNLLPYTLWLLPLYTWLMLVSMVSSKAPFLWAILPVILILILEGFITRYFHLESSFFLNLLADYFSISQTTIDTYIGNHVMVSMAPMTVISEKISLAGIALSGIFIYITYWFRANKSHH